MTDIPMKQADDVAKAVKILTERCDLADFLDDSLANLVPVKEVRALIASHRTGDRDRAVEPAMAR